MSKPASPNQIGYIRSLLEERTEVLGISDLEGFIAEHSIDLVTADSASKLIDKLRSTPRVIEQRDESNKVVTGPPNSYPGNCEECGHYVDAMEGWRNKIGARWAVHHHAGMCNPLTPTTAAAPAGKQSLNEILEGIENGYFALPCKTDSNDLDFIRIGTNQGRVNPEHKGLRRVQRFIGGDGPVTMGRPEQVIFARAIAALTPEERLAAQQLFGQTVGSCARCGRSLTDQISRAAGLGPECRSK